MPKLKLRRSCSGMSLCLNSKALFYLKDNLEKGATKPVEINHMNAQLDIHRY